MNTGREARQGSCMPPLLFSIYTEAMMEESKASREGNKDSRRLIIKGCKIFGRQRRWLLEVSLNSTVNYEDNIKRANES